MWQSPEGRSSVHGSRDRFLLARAVPPDGRKLDRAMTRDTERIRKQRQHAGKTAWRTELGPIEVNETPLVPEALGPATLRERGTSHPRAP